MNSPIVPLIAYIWTEEYQRLKVIIEAHVVLHLKTTVHVFYRYDLFITSLYLLLFLLLLFLFIFIFFLFIPIILTFTFFLFRTLIDNHEIIYDDAEGAVLFCSDGEKELFSFFFIFEHDLGDEVLVGGDGLVLADA